MKLLATRRRIIRIILLLLWTALLVGALFAQRDIGASEALRRPEPP